MKAERWLQAGFWGKGRESRRPSLGGECLRAAGAKKVGCEGRTGSQWMAGLGRPRFKFAQMQQKQKKEKPSLVGWLAEGGSWLDGSKNMDREESRDDYYGSRYKKRTA